MLQCILLGLIFFTISCSEAKVVRVTLKQGVLEGQVLVPSTGKGTYNSFKGIPYATPPLGKLRFKAPTSPLPWKGIRRALNHGPICIQHRTIYSTLVIGSEDCLYLNVYTPNLNPDTPLPVMFFIHPGYYITGSGNSDKYGPDFLMDYGVVLVTINYRLDALGFLAVDTEDVPGNAGMKDQIAALKWVQSNIKKFGGDPSRVTIFGPTAGAFSVTLHLLSPSAKGLFSRAIAMSGVFFNDAAITFDHRKRAFSLGSQLGTNTTDPHELIEYLQSVPARKLVSVRPNIFLTDEISRKLHKTFYFTPIVEQVQSEDQYLTQSPGDLLSAGKVNEVNFMAGHTQNEGLLSTSRNLNDILKYYSQYEYFYVPKKISYIRSPIRVRKLADQIKNYYITNQTIRDSIRGFTNYASYSRFVYEIHNFFDLYSSVNSKQQYFYMFKFYSSRNVYSRDGARMFGIKEATRMDDVPYLFDGPFYDMPVNVRSSVFKCIDIMCRLYTNFAKYGNPTPDASFGTTWPAYNPGKNYLNISDPFTVGQVVYTGNLGFWQNIYNEAEVEPYFN